MSERLRAALDDLRADRSAHVLALLLIAAGVMLRLAHYLSGRSLWIDEAALTINVFHRSALGLAEPLDYEQAAPYGFLLAVKAAVAAFGTSELALRLVPLLFGVAALPVVYAAARKVTSRGGALAALLMFACAEGAIYYSAELKQYAGDLFAVPALLAVALTRTEFTWRRYLAVSLAGAALLWFSHASLFVLASITTTYGVVFLRDRRRDDLLRSAAASVVWLASLAVFYLVSARDATSLRDRLSYSTRLAVDARVWLEEVVGHVGYAIGMPDSQALAPQLVRMLAALLAVVGFVALARRRPATAAILGLTGLFFVVAVELKLYPLFQRTLVFLVPIVVLLVGHGVATVAGRLPARAALVGGVALTAAVSAYTVADAAHDVAEPRVTEEIRPLLGELAARWRPGDTLYVHWAAQHAFTYYAECDCIGASRSPPLTLVTPAPPGPDLFSRSVMSRPPELVVGRHADYPFRPTLAEIERLDGRERVWILSSHVSDAADEEFLDRRLPAYLERIGDRRAAFARRRARLLLFDLSSAS